MATILTAEPPVSFLSDNKFPFKHLVTTRTAGDMRDVSSRDALCRHAGVEAGALITAEQVHGGAVAAVDSKMKGQRIESADGLVTNDTGAALAVFTADCLPVFIASKQPYAVGVIHAGWRGLAVGIIRNGITKMVEEYGVRAEKIHASIGPHIGKCCYSIGQDLKTIFKVSDDMLDIEAVAAIQLRECGVRFVSSIGHCTAHESGMFFSYRREKTTARMMSLIWGAQ